MELLRAEGLFCGYNGKEVLKGINFTVKDGDFLGIIGPNGSGKTTLLRALTKTLRPIKGDIFYKGQRLVNISVKDLAKEVAVLPQVLEIPFSFSVEEFVLMGRNPYLNRFETPKKRDFEIVRGVLKEADIEDLRYRGIKSLSGGERQRVFFAQALAQQPKLLLLDEPVTHLDIKHQIEILDLLRDLNKSGLAIIVILHDLNLASEYCKELLLLNEGEIYIKGNPEEVLRYEIIEEVYKAVVVVKTNPLSSKPYVLLVSKSELEKRLK